MEGANPNEAGTQQDAAGRPVAIVVDSTADLPPEQARALDIAVVPLIVRFGERTFRDGVDLTPSAFLAELTASTASPSTSQPAVADFQTAFQTALDAGKDVVCLTIASQLSGTHNAARLAAEAVDPQGARVRVVDSGTVSGQLGLVAIEAALAALAGASPDEIVATVRSALTRSQIYVVLETLEYLQKGGRIGRAQALLGAVLSVKPIVTVQEGTVVPLERVRTWRKALDRIAELGREKAPLAALAIYHAGNPDDAKVLTDRLADLVPPDRLLLGEIGPVVATYGGPGLVGIAPLAVAD
jgi:DegV family protein with EDD domain